MKARVVDASVVAAAFFAEKDTAAARSLILSDVVLLAPDLIYAEVANVVWKRRRGGEIDDQEALGVLADVLDLPLEITPSEQLVRAALELATRTARTVYDCLYLALAMQQEAVMVTGDRRLVNALAAGPLRDYAAWVGAKA